LLSEEEQAVEGLTKQAGNNGKQETQKETDDWF